MRIYLLLGHPDSTSFNGALADAYEMQAKAAGHEVHRQNLGDLQFDPILWHGYHTVQELEPDLVTAQQNIAWCDHWVIIYPIWWDRSRGCSRASSTERLRPALHTAITRPIPCGMGC